MHFLITAGPTREAIDPVRYISNRSSGKMGYALAAAAVARGHEVTLVSGPVSIPAPAGVRRISVVSAEEMYHAVQAHLPAVQIAIFSAAVADYRPASVAGQKIKKNDDQITLTLERTRDILGSARTAFGYRGILVGFAAETENVLANAASKLQRKGCDMLVANDVSGQETGFDTDQNEVTLLFRDASALPLPRAEKSGLAERIIDECERLAGG